MPATLYRWDDVSAPAMSSTLAGSLYDILKAVLIDGYGTRTPVGGWTAAYDDGVNHKVVLKNANEEIYYRVDDNIDYRYARCQMFTAMTDIDTGTGRLPGIGKTLYDELCIGKRYTTTVSDGYWSMLVDDAGEWFYFWTWSTTYPSGFFFGKMPSHDGFTKRWFMPGYDQPTQTSSAAPRTLWTADGGLNVSYTNKGRWNIEGVTEACEWQQPEEAMGQPDPITGKLIFAKEYIRTANAPYVVLGYWPNRIVSWGALSNPGFAPNDKIVMGGKKYAVAAHSTIYFLMEYDSDTG